MHKEAVWISQALMWGVRASARRLASSLTIAIAVGLAVGLSTVVLTVLDVVIIQATPYPDSEQLVDISCQRAQNSPGSCSALAMEAVKEQSETVDELALYRFGPIRLQRTGTEPQVVGTRRVSSGFFSTLGVRPVAGRWFLDSDNEGTSNLVILSSRTRAAMFAANETPIGETVTLDNLPYVVIGVMPTNFGFPDSDVAAWVLDPLSVARLEGNSFDSRVIARLKDGRDVQNLRAEFDLLGRRLPPPTSESAMRLVATPLRSMVLGSETKVIWILFVGTLCLCGIVAANISSLLAARGQLTSHYRNIRMALGASRSRVTAECLVEHLVLIVPSAVVGLGIAVFALRVFQQLGQLGVSRAEFAAVDWRASAYTIVLSILVIGAAASAALWASKPSASLVVSRGGSTQRAVAGMSAWSFQKGSLALQLAFVALLLAVATSASRLLVSVWNIPLGFEPRHLFAIDLPSPSSTSLATLFRDSTEVIEQVEAVQGVVSVAVASHAPLTGSRTIPALPMQNSLGEWHEGPQTRTLVVSQEYFSLMGITVLAGRTFSPIDTSATPCAAVVNRALADAFGSFSQALRSAISSNIFSGADANRCTVIGVVENVRDDRVNAPPGPEAYFSNQQLRRSERAVMFRVSNPAVVNAVKDTLARRLGGRSNIAVIDVDRYVAGHTKRERLLSYTILVFAVCGFLIALLGVVGGVSAYLAGSARDMAVRIALGAGRGHLVMGLLKDCAPAYGVGLVIGTITAHSAARWYLPWTPGLVPISVAERWLVAGSAYLLVLLLAMAPIAQLRVKDLTARLRLND